MNLFKNNEIIFELSGYNILIGCLYLEVYLVQLAVVMQCFEQNTVLWSLRMIIYDCASDKDAVKRIHFVSREFQFIFRLKIMLGFEFNW